MLIEIRCNARLGAEHHMNTNFSSPQSGSRRGQVRARVFPCAARGSALDDWCCAVVLCGSRSGQGGELSAVSLYEPLISSLWLHQSLVPAATVAARMPAALEMVRAAAALAPAAAPRTAASAVPATSAADSSPSPASLTDMIIGPQSTTTHLASGHDRCPAPSSRPCPVTPVTLRRGHVTVPLTYSQGCAGPATGAGQ